MEGDVHYAVGSSRMKTPAVWSRTPSRASLVGHLDGDMPQNELTNWSESDTSRYAAETAVGIRGGVAPGQGRVSWQKGRQDGSADEAAESRDT